MTPRSRRARVLRTLALFSGGLAVLAVGLAAYQKFPDNPEITKYKFTLARIYYTPPSFSFWGPVGASNGPPWRGGGGGGGGGGGKIMAEVTKLDVNPEGHIV